MGLKFSGDYAQLKKCVSRTGFKGQWRELKDHQSQYRTDSGAVLNWWCRTGSINFQGQDPEMKFERKVIESAKGRVDQKRTENPLDPREENAALRKLLERAFVANAKLKKRLSKWK